MPLLFSVLVVAWFPAVTPRDLPRLDPEFGKWAATDGIKTYESILVQFLEASGQPTEEYLDTIVELEKEIRSTVGDRSDPRAHLEAMRDVLFRRRKLVSDPDLTNLDNLLPNRILECKRGYCLGLSLVVLHLGERLGWPIVGVWTPRHTFVRYRGDPPYNFETTLSGAVHDDAWYQRRFDLSGQSKLVELSSRRLCAHLINNYGYVLIENGQLMDARSQFESALELFPGLVEARINLGVAAARAQQYAEAIRHFSVASKAWPGDPYISLNRVIALVPGGRISEATETATDLLKKHPRFTPALEQLGRIRSEIDRRAHWTELQSLSDALNRARLGDSARKRGLPGQYFGGRNFEKKILERVDKDIAFSWRWGAPAPGVPRDNFSVRWNGYFEVAESDRYTFRGVCSDGIRMRIDGALVLDEWRVTTDNFAETTVRLEPGIHDITIEYFESRGDAGVLVLVTAEKQELVIDLGKFFFHPTR